MVTIAFGWVVWKILQEWVSVTGGDLGIPLYRNRRSACCGSRRRSFYYVVLALFLAALALQVRLVSSQFGTRMRAVKDSEIAVASVGIDVYRLKVIVFVISAAFAGLAGHCLRISRITSVPTIFSSSVGVLSARRVVRRRRHHTGAGYRRQCPYAAARDAARFRQIPSHRLRLSDPAYVYFLPNGVMGLATRRGKPQGATDTQVRATTKRR